MALTPAELTILGLLIEKPGHGYELEQVIERRGIRQWTELGFSSIYYLLGRLEKRGLVAAGSDAGSGCGAGDGSGPSTAPGPRSRRVFHVTDAGRAAARDAVLTAVGSPQPVFSPFLTALANRPLVSDDDFLAALRHRRDALAAQIAAVRAARAARRPLPPHAEAVFDYSLHLMEAEQTWLDRAGTEGTDA